MLMKLKMSRLSLSSSSFHKVIQDNGLQKLYQVKGRRTELKEKMMEKIRPTHPNRGAQKSLRKSIEGSTRHEAGLHFSIQACSRFEKLKKNMQM